MRNMLWPLLLTLSIGGVGCSMPAAVGEAPPANVERERFSSDGMGVVIGLRGHGDGPSFAPLVRILSEQPELRGIEPRDAALVTVSRSAADADGRVWLWISSVGRCDDLRDGYLTTTAMFKDSTMEEVYFVSGAVRVDPRDSLAVGTSRSLLLSKANLK